MSLEQDPTGRERASGSTPPTSASGSELTNLQSRLLTATRQFARLLPQMVDSAEDRAALVVEGERLHTVVGFAVRAPVVDAGALDRYLPSLRSGVQGFARLTSRLQLDLLADEPNEFDDEAYDKRVHGLTDEELERELERLLNPDGDDDESDADTLDELEALLDDGGSAPGALGRIGKLTRLKAILRLLIEFILRIKFPDRDILVRILRKILKNIDKIVGGKGGGGMGPHSTPGQGGSPGGGGSTPSTPRDESCVIQVYLKEITATDLGNIGSNNDWTFDITVDGADPYALKGSFDRSHSPATFGPIRDKHRRTVFTNCPCGKSNFRIDVKGTQTAGGIGTNDVGTESLVVDYVCDEPKRDVRVEVRVYNNSKTTNAFATVTLVFELATACTSVPCHPD